MVEKLLLVKYNKTLENGSLTTECLSCGFGNAMALLPSPHPGQSSLVGIRKDPVGLQQVKSKLT